MKKLISTMIKRFACWLEGGHDWHVHSNVKQARSWWQCWRCGKQEVFIPEGVDNG